MLLCLCATISLLLAAPQAAARDDVETLRARLIESIIPRDGKIVEQLTADAARHAASLGEDGSWKDIDYADRARTGWKTQEHARRLLAMSKGVRITGDAALLARTLAALDHWLEKDFQNPNWWHNEIGTPQLIGESAVLIGGENLSAARREKIDRLMSRGDWKKWTGQNLIWGVTNQVLRGLIGRDEPMITQAYDRLHDEIVITTREGIQPDGSFHQHGPQFYSGGYGLAFAMDVARFTAFAWGTRWQAPMEKLEIFNRFMLDGQRWMMHYDRFDDTARGREIARRGATAVTRDWTGAPVSPRGAAYSLRNAVRLLAQHPVPRRQDYLDWLRSLAGETEAPRPRGNRHFWRSDYMVHHGQGWMASVRMFSDRLINTEQVNSEGRKSHHLADGVNLLYVSGNEYFDLFPAWDWTKVPGTTAEQNTLDFEEGREIGVKGRTSFVGGVSDGACGLAVMDLARGKLAARKAWFFFDNGYLCLGAGITCRSENAVATSVNQCRINGEIAQRDNWIHHAGVGYVFPAGVGDVRVTTGEQTGNWSDLGVQIGEVRAKVFNAWLDHGVRPDGATYAYTVYPAADADRTARYAGDPKARVIANTARQQAIYHERLDVRAVAFWEAGRAEVAGKRIEVDRPCLLLLSGGKVSLANPQNQPVVVNVTIDGGPPIKAELPGGEAAGASVTLSTTP